MSDLFENRQPLIVAFVADLMFSTQITKVIEYLEYRVVWIEDGSEIGDIDPLAPVEKPGELLHGREGKLFEKITKWQPVLLLFDLTNSGIPWRMWIAALKSSPATRRIPILCFGPHEDVATMQAAKDMGADVVVARSRFMRDMPDLFTRHARVPDRDALLEFCAEPLPPMVREGIDLFNRGAFYKCHDALEEAWMQETGPGRDLYRGILQVGIAYYQIERGNYRGAVKMLLRVRQWLGPLPAICRGVDVARLRRDADRVYAAIVDLGPDRMDELNRDLFRPIFIT
jgi:predicted metal-dependent hydrolase